MTGPGRHGTARRDAAPAPSPRRVPHQGTPRARQGSRPARRVPEPGGRTERTLISAPHRPRSADAVTPGRARPVRSALAPGGVRGGARGRLRGTRAVGGTHRVGVGQVDADQLFGLLAAAAVTMARGAVLQVFHVDEVAAAGSGIERTEHSYPREATTVTPVDISSSKHRAGTADTYGYRRKTAFCDQRPPSASGGRPIPSTTGLPRRASSAVHVISLSAGWSRAMPPSLPGRRRHPGHACPVPTPPARSSGWCAPPRRPPGAARRSPSGAR